jgi:hypothetical protein
VVVVVCRRQQQQQQCAMSASTLARAGAHTTTDTRRCCPASRRVACWAVRDCSPPCPASAAACTCGARGCQRPPQTWLRVLLFCCFVRRGVVVARVWSAGCLTGARCVGQQEQARWRWDCGATRHGQLSLKAVFVLNPTLIRHTLRLTCLRSTWLWPCRGAQRL